MAVIPFTPPDKYGVIGPVKRALEREVVETFFQER